MCELFELVYGTNEFSKKLAILKKVVDKSIIDLPSILLTQLQEMVEKVGGNKIGNTIEISSSGIYEMANKNRKKIKVQTFYKIKEFLSQSPEGEGLTNLLEDALPYQLPLTWIDRTLVTCTPFQSESLKLLSEMFYLRPVYDGGNLDISTGSFYSIMNRTKEGKKNSYVIRRKRITIEEQAIALIKAIVSSKPFQEDQNTQVITCGLLQYFAPVVPIWHLLPATYQTETIEAACKHALIETEKEWIALLSKQEYQSDIPLEIPESMRRKGAAEEEEPDVSPSSQTKEETAEAETNPLEEFKRAKQHFEERRRKLIHAMYTYRAQHIEDTCKSAFQHGSTLYEYLKLIGNGTEQVLHIEWSKDEEEFWQTCSYIDKKIPIFLFNILKEMRSQYHFPVAITVTEFKEHSALDILVISRE